MSRSRYFGFWVLWMPCILFAGEDADDRLHTLAEFVVSPYRYETEAERLPGQFHALGSWELEASPAIHLSQVLAREPGVSVQSFTGGWGSAELKMRGFGGNSGLRVLVLLDGMKLNRPDMRPFSWGQVPMALLERVEILEGSHSTLYGNHAVGGVILLHTRSITDTPETHIRGTVGSHGLLHGSLLQTIPMGESVGAWVGVDLYEESGYRDNAASSGESAFGRVEWRLSKDTEVRLWGTYAALEQEFPGPLTRELFETEPRTSLLPGQQADQTYGSLQGKVIHRNVGEGEGTLSFGWSRDAQDWDFQGIHGEGTGWHGYVNPQWVWRWDWGTTMGGIDASRDTLRFARFRTPARTRAIGKARLVRQSTAAYFFQEWTPVESWSVTAGLRMERASLRAEIQEWETFGNPGDPPKSEVDEGTSDDGIAVNLGVVRRLGEGRRVWFRYDRLYRYPVVDEVASYQGYPLPEAFHAELRPERGHNLEVGGSWAAGPWSFDLGAFQQWMYGEIDFYADPTGSTTTTTPTTRRNDNLPDIQRTGVRGGIEWATQGWLLRWDGSWIDARFREGHFAGNRRHLVPRWENRFLVEWLPTPKWRVGSHVKTVSSAFVGDDLANELDPIPSYTLVDVHLAWNPTPNFRVLFSIDNLLDRTHATVAYRGDWYPGPGRTATLRCQLQF